MKVITFFVIKWVFVATQFSQGTNMCVGRMDGIVFPDSESCDTFIQCQRGSVTKQRCQIGTSFDLNLYYCVPRHAVDCGQRKQQNLPISPPNLGETPPTSESFHSVCRNMKNGALIANPQNCRAYIECQQNLRLDRECLSNELFENTSGVCLRDFTVDCGDRKISPSNDDVTIRNVCLGQQNGVLVADPRDCRRYFNCQNQQRKDGECGEGELFEVNLGRCVNSGAVNCNGRAMGNNANISPPHINSEGGIPAKICNGMPSGTRISNPLNCQRYFECQNNQRTDLTCPSNQAFDMPSNQCRASSLVSCGNRRSINNNAQQTTICQGQRNGRRLENPTNCRAFIECQANARIDRSCENGNLFDTHVENCLPAHSVRCGSRRILPNDLETQSPEDFFPPCPRTGVVFRSHPHDCQGYFICADGNLIQHSCASGIYFNPDTFQCDLPQNVQCRLSRIVVPQTPLLPDCSSGARFFPNLVNCKQYYKCVNKMPQLVDCPIGHLWNNLQLRCDKSESEICARRFDNFRGKFEYSKPDEDEKKE